MAGNTDTDYFNYSLDLTSPLLTSSFPEGEVMSVILWVIARLVIHDGVVSFPFMELHPSILESIRTAAPGIPLKKNLAGLRHLLKAASQRLVMKNNIKIINTEMFAKFGSLSKLGSIFSFVYQADEIRFATPYYVFLKFVSIMVLYTDHQIWRCSTASRLVMGHEFYQTVASYLQTTLHKLDEGTINLHTAEEILKLVDASRDNLKRAFEAFLMCPVEVPNNWIGWQESIFKRLFPKFKTHSRISIAEIKLLQVNGTLHNYNVEQGPEFFDWKEVATLNSLVENSRLRIASNIEHPRFGLERLAQDIRKDMDQIKTQVLFILMDPQTAETEALVSLTSDMRKAASKLSAAAMMGLSFTVENFGVDWTLFDFLCEIIEDKIQQKIVCSTNNPDTEG